MNSIDKEFLLDFAEFLTNVYILFVSVSFIFMSLDSEVSLFTAFVTSATLGLTFTVPFFLFAVLDVTHGIPNPGRYIRKLLFD